VLDQGRAEPAGFDYERADLTDDAAVRRTAPSAVGRLARLDLLLSNAGIRAVGGIEDTSTASLALVRATRPAL
jgi:NAD(P)-dependent dehydrogenase (short-subunit alcohol dehydrogenase family)